MQDQENRQQPDYRMLRKATLLGYEIRVAGNGRNITLLPRRNAEGLEGAGTKLFPDADAANTWLNLQLVQS